MRGSMTWVARRQQPNDGFILNLDYSPYYISIHRKEAKLGFLFVWLFTIREQGCCF